MYTDECVNEGGRRDEKEGRKVSREGGRQGGREARRKEGRITSQSNGVILSLVEQAGLERSNELS